MYNTASIPLLSTHEASKRTGYTHDYMARMCREGRIRGKRVGASWMIAEAELDRFSAAHAARLAQTRAAVQAIRRREFLAPIAVRHVEEDRYGLPRGIRALRVMQEGIAIAVAVMVVATSVAFAESPHATHAIKSARGMVLEAGRGFAYLVEDKYAQIVESGRDLKIPESTSYFAISTESLEGNSIAAFSDVPQIYAVSVPSAPVSYGIERTPTRIFSNQRGAYEKDGASVGKWGLSVGAGIRDAAIQAPKSVFLAAAATGERIVHISNALQSAHQRAIFAFSAVPQKLAPAILISLHQTGAYTAQSVVAAPRFFQLAYDSAISHSVRYSRYLSYLIVERELSLGKAITFASHASSKWVYQAIHRSELGVYAAMLEAANTAVARLPYQEAGTLARAIESMRDHASAAAYGFLEGLPGTR